MSRVVEQIDPTELGELHRYGNKALMVAWINADLLNRAHHDVRTSVVLYDEDKDFVFALRDVPDQVALQELYERTTVRYYSVGGI